jgi:hypothetical protein
MLSGNPGISPTEVRSALTGTAIDIEASGYDRDTGFGIVMPERALRQTGATPQPLVTADDPVITPAPTATGSWSRASRRRSRSRSPTAVTARRPG